MDLHPNLLSGSLDLLYDGLLWPERWSDFLTYLRRRLGCEHAIIGFHDNDNAAPVVAFSSGLSRQRVREWNSLYGRKNPRSSEIRRVAAARGSWASVNSLCNADAAYRETEYVQWLYQHDLYHSLLLAVRTGQAYISLSLTRPKSAKPFPPEWTMMMGGLAPHLGRVFQIHRRNEALCARFEAGKIALDRLDAGVIALDERGRIVMMNERAETILGKNRGLSARRGQLVARNPFEARDLERLLTSTARAEVTCDTGKLCGLSIHGDQSSNALSVVMTPLHSNHILAGEQPCALLFLYDRAAKPAGRGAALRVLFGLTPAESRLADVLHQELDLREAAEKMHITLGTARFMLKNIFAKTGTRRQSELVHLLSRLPGESH